MAMTDRRCIVSQPVAAEGLLVKRISIGAPFKAPSSRPRMAWSCGGGSIGHRHSSLVRGSEDRARRDGHQACARAGASHRLDRPIAVARTAVVVGILVTAVVLRDAVVGRGRGLRGG